MDMFLCSLCPVYSQPIICKAGAYLLKTHFLPTLEKLRKKTVKVSCTWAERRLATPAMSMPSTFRASLRYSIYFFMQVVAEEELLKADSKGDTQEAELLILNEFAVLCRDLYSFYPMLIRYVDNNRCRNVNV